MTAKRVGELEIDETISFEPVTGTGIIVRLQRTQFAYAVWVEHTLIVGELRRAFVGEAGARSYARGLCLSLRAGWSLDRLAEIAAIPTAGQLA